jgi:hypothetical protein
MPRGDGAMECWSIGFVGIRSVFMNAIMQNVKIEPHPFLIFNTPPIHHSLVFGAVKATPSR